MGEIAGRIVKPETIAAAQASLDRDLEPPADQHGSPEMKRHLARVLLARALHRIAGGEGARAA
jgi:carbon-monoxide dehydrogenase medium subunit